MGGVVAGSINLSIKLTQADLSAALVAMHLWVESYTVVLLGWQAVLLVGRLLAAYKSIKRRLRLQSSISLEAPFGLLTKAGRIVMRICGTHGKYLPATQVS